MGVVFLGVQMLSVYIAVHKTPIHAGTSWVRGLRKSFAAAGPHGRQWVDHPWRMTAIYLAGWIAFSLVLGGRLAKGT